MINFKTYGNIPSREDNTAFAVTLFDKRGRKMENINLEKIKSLGLLDKNFKRHFQDYYSSDISELDNLCKKVKEGQITAPIFQEKPKWTVQEAISTFNFILANGFFSLPFAFNVITDKPKVKQLSFPDYKPIDSSHKYNNTLSIISGSKVLDMYYKAYVGNSIFNNVVFDLSTGKIRLLKYDLPDMDKICSLNFLLASKPEIFFNEFCKIYGIDDYDWYDDDADDIYDIKCYLTEFRTRFFWKQCTVSLAKDLNKKEQLKWRRQLHLSFR